MLPQEEGSVRKDQEESIESIPPRKHRLDHFLESSQPDWTRKEVASVQAKLARVGIASLHKLIPTVRLGAKDSINKLLKEHDEKLFTSDTVSALAEKAFDLQTPLIGFLRSAQPAWTPKQYYAVLDKLAQVEILGIDELTDTLRLGARDNLNARFKREGIKCFTQETLDALRQHAGVGRKSDPDGTRSPDSQGIGMDWSRGPVETEKSKADLDAEHSLHDFLQSARSDWSAPEIRTVKTKFAIIGISRVEDLISVLQERGKQSLNERLKSHKQKPLTSKAILDLQSHSRARRDLSSGMPAQSTLGQMASLQPVEVESVSSVDDLLDEDAQHLQITCFEIGPAGIPTTPRPQHHSGQTIGAYGSTEPGMPPEPSWKECAGEAAGFEATAFGLGRPEGSPLDGAWSGEGPWECPEEAAPLPAMAGAASVGGQCPVHTEIVYPDAQLQEQVSRERPWQRPESVGSDASLDFQPALALQSQMPADSGLGSSSTGFPEDTSLLHRSELGSAATLLMDWSEMDALQQQDAQAPPLAAKLSSSSEFALPMLPSLDVRLDLTPRQIEVAQGCSHEEQRVERGDPLILGPQEAPAVAVGEPDATTTWMEAPQQHSDESSLDGSCEPRQREKLGDDEASEEYVIDCTVDGGHCIEKEHGAEAFSTESSGQTSDDTPAATQLAGDIVTGQECGDASTLEFQCASPACIFRVHSLLEKGPYCCIACLKGNPHGKECERVPSRTGAQKAPRGWRVRLMSDVWVWERKTYGITLWQGGTVPGGPEEATAVEQQESGAEAAGRGAEGLVSPWRPRVQAPIKGPSGWLLGEEELQLLWARFSPQELGRVRPSWDRRELFLFLQSGGRFLPDDMSSGYRRPPAPPTAPRVSVLVPTMDRRHEWHSRLYDTFASQTWPEKELVVVETFLSKPSAFLEQKARDDERVIYVPFRVQAGKDFTIGLKRNMCVHLASGTYVANFDDDDLYAPRYLETMVQAMEKSRSNAATLSSWYIFDCNTGRFGHVSPQKQMALKKDMDHHVFGYGFSYVSTLDVALRTPYPDWVFDPSFDSQEDWEWFSAIRMRHAASSGRHCIPYMEPSGTVLLEDKTGICLHCLHRTSTSDSWAHRELRTLEINQLEVNELGEVFSTFMKLYPQQGRLSNFIPNNVANTGRVVRKFHFVGPFPQPALFFSQYMRR